MLLFYTTRHCYVYGGEEAAKRPCGPLVYCRHIDSRGGPEPPKDMHWGGPKSKGPPNKNKHVWYLSWILTKQNFFLDRFFLLKILKTAYHLARPRFYNNNHNTSMFITQPIYCTSFICVRLKLIILTVCLSVKSRWGKSSPLQQGTEERGHTDTRSVRAYQHSHSILQWCHTGGDLMDGAITGEPGFLIEGTQITCNDVFKYFWNEALFTGQR